MITIKHIGIGAESLCFYNIHHVDQYLVLYDSWYQISIHSDVQQELCRRCNNLNVWLCIEICPKRLNTNLLPFAIICICVSIHSTKKVQTPIQFVQSSSRYHSFDNVRILFLSNGISCPVQIKCLIVIASSARFIKTWRRLSP